MNTRISPKEINTDTNLGNSASSRDGFQIQQPRSLPHQTGFYHSNNSLNIWIFLAHFHLKIRIFSQSQLDVFMALIGLSEAPFPRFCPSSRGFLEGFPQLQLLSLECFPFWGETPGGPQIAPGLLCQSREIRWNKMG